MRMMSDPRYKHLKSAIRRVLDCISSEWKRRQLITPPDEYFKWPTTEAEGGNGALFGSLWPAVGLLRFMGYVVGCTHGKPTELRHAILAEIFRCHLPPVESPAYMLEWCEPTSAARLKKIAETIAALTRNAKRRHDGLMSEAIRDWERDLLFLYQKYYLGHFHFGWPSAIP
jgi:hypothetical protein